MTHPEAKRDEFLALIRELDGRPPRVPQVWAKQLTHKHTNYDMYNSHTKPDSPYHKVLACIVSSAPTNVRRHVQLAQE